MSRQSLFAAQLIILMGILVYCSSSLAQNFSATKSNAVIRLATTTSTQNSGLLQHILPEFEQHSGYQVHVIAVGTGKALKMGKDGDVDVLMVHAPTAEKQFIQAGYGIKRYELMYNDFVLVGPSNDPAGLHQAKTARQAMAKINQQQSLFISRGDDSGTHKKELQLWPDSSRIKEKQWYREAGQGMGKVLQIANELDAYTLTDRGTWLSHKGRLTLKIVFFGDPALFNPYGVIALNPQRYADLNHQGAQALINWLISPEAQQLIGDYRVNNTRLFTPSAKASQVAESK